MFFKKLSGSIFTIVFSLTLLINLASSSSSAESDSTTKRPPPPRRIPPNKVKPGGGLDFNHQSCNQANKSLTALVPVDNPVLTIKAYPSFLFYIPDAPTQMSHGEFSLLTANEKKRIYQTSITFEQTPGIIKIDIPPSSQYALESGQIYHWYLKIYCGDLPETDKLLDVNGWVQRIPLTPKIESQIETSSTDIWYDAIAQAADDLIATPQSPIVRDQWLKLMQHIDQEHLVDILIPVTNASDKTIGTKR